MWLNDPSMSMRSYECARPRKRYVEKKRFQVVKRSLLILFFFLLRSTTSLYADDAGNVRADT